MRKNHDELSISVSLLWSTNPNRYLVTMTHFVRNPSEYYFSIDNLCKDIYFRNQVGIFHFVYYPSKD